MSVRLLSLADAASIPGVDPHSTPVALAAEAAERRARAVVAEVEAGGLTVAYPLLLQSGGDHGLLARTSEYGGPFVRAGAPTPIALSSVRSRLDDALAAAGVVSEVAMLAPDLPARDEIAGHGARSTARRSGSLTRPPSSGATSWARAGAAT